mmetsp:Transcript_1976/g.3974  ORF Transcript_1976/g.3974 Transcript_1976/m.3974 type:complete len:269 (+) Transcript_1976:166-972(+)|eukprot:CAMPEP_0118658144 /NCGR_PEP_ID=MMETSP0785-20121206/14404_1 /TAXON_ID=91992 /ORGANISM="Bolidomonas pacifica, Strain CCMP 1866" /LENGTH=268 /DNA_ID=CAMNT_0006551127 /DNA_START=149 /DNA_END=955 /DNA_ORIENTATION=+
MNPAESSLDSALQPSPPDDPPKSNRRSRLPTIWTLSNAHTLQQNIPITPANPLIRLVYTSVLKSTHQNVPSIQSFVNKANERNPIMNIGGWLYVDEKLTNCEQILEGPRSSVERLFYGKKVTDKNGTVKDKQFWVGGIYGDPVHTVKKVFEQKVEEGAERVYEFWGMSWAITNSNDESTGGSSRRLAKIVAKQPCYGKWLGSGNDEDLVEALCNDDEEFKWVSDGERKASEEGDVVEVDGEEKGNVKKDGEMTRGGRRLRLGNMKAGM